MLGAAVDDISGDSGSVDGTDQSGSVLCQVTVEHKVRETSNGQCDDRIVKCCITHHG